MNEQALAAELATLLTGEARSLFRHLHDDSRPYLTPATYRVWRDLAAVAVVSADHVRRLTTLIDALGLPVPAPVFDTLVANYHDTSLNFLLPLLADDRERQAAAYDRALTHAASDPVASPVLQSLRDETLRQVAQLRALAAVLVAA